MPVKSPREVKKAQDISRLALSLNDISLANQSVLQASTSRDGEPILSPVYRNRAYRPVPTGAESALSFNKQEKAMLTAKSATKKQAPTLTQRYRQPEDPNRVRNIMAKYLDGSPNQDRHNSLTLPYISLPAVQENRSLVYGYF